MKLGISLDIDELNQGFLLIQAHPQIEHIQIHYNANTKLQDYKKLIDRIKTTHTHISFSLHAYNEINFAELNKEVLAAWKKVAKQTIDDAASIGCIFINFHYGMFCEGSKIKEDYRDKVLQEFNSLQEYAELNKVEIHIENIYSAPYNCEYQFLGDSLEDFRILSNKNVKIGICYDLGHGNISGFTDEFFELYVSKIKSIHAHDNNRINDLHQPLGTGTIKWDEIFVYLKRTLYDSFFILEHDAEQYSISLEYLKKYNVI